MDNHDIRPQYLQEMLTEITKHRYTDNSLMPKLRQKGTIDQSDYATLIDSKYKHLESKI